MPNDWHLVHLGSRAVGGAGLVHGRDDGRVARGAHLARLRRMYRTSTSRAGGGSSSSSTAGPSAKIGMQLGHAGRKGSTRRLWEGDVLPLPEGNWPLCRPRRSRTTGINQVPREMTRAPRWTQVLATTTCAPRAGRTRPVSTCSSCTTRTATCSPASSRR